MSPTDLIQATRDELVDTCVKQAEQIALLEGQLQWLKEQVQLANHRQFGPSSERSSAEQRAFIFNEAEVEAPAPEPPTTETLTYTRRKTVGKREALLRSLPTETVPHRLPVEAQICPQCEGPLHEMGHDDRRELLIIPAQAKVLVHEQYKYTCRHCDRHETTTPVVAAPVPAPVLKNSLASPSAVAYILTQKYVDGLPLYRQEQQLARLGLDLSRSVLANWTLVAADWFSPIYDRLQTRLRLLDILHADETPLQVLQEPGRAAQTQSYMWLYRSGRDGPPIVCFDYQETRAAEHPKDFLAGFTGHLHADGYVGYVGLPGVTRVGCWAHARRKFDECLKALPPHLRAAPGTLSQEGFAYCNALFKIERELHDVTPAERYAGRQARSRPVLDAFQAWLQTAQAQVAPKCVLGQAIGYCVNQWEALIAFLEDGRLELDNNRAERTIKPFVIGRKNWLFANTPRGARASAIHYSLAETAKENGLNPLLYFTYLLERLPNLSVTTPEALDSLLPWTDAVQAACTGSSRPPV